MSTFTKQIVWLLSVLSLMAFTPGISPAAQDPSSMTDPFTYEGADRDQRLLAAARKEGSVLFYTTLTTSDLKPIISGFEKKYGIKLNVWRASGDTILERISAEATANRFDFDVTRLSTSDMEGLRREKMLQVVKSPHFKDLITAALPAHREWAGESFGIYVQAYNTTKVKKAELPKTYRDLLDPRWKGRLGIEATNHEWFYAIVKDMGEEKGLKFFRDLVAINNPSQRTGKNLLTNLVLSGEVPLALGIYHFAAEQAKRKGAPVDWFTLEPTFATSFCVAVSKKPVHPAAAMLLYDYMITDAQKPYMEQSRVIANKKYDSPLKNIKFKAFDPLIITNESEKSTKLYEDILQRK